MNNTKTERATEVVMEEITFDKIFDAKEEDVRKMNKDVYKSQMQRKAEEKRDYARLEISKNKIARQKELMKIENCDFNKIVQMKQEDIVLCEHIACLDKIIDMLFGA